MNLITFRITMDEYPDVVRVIQTQDSRTFEDLHHAVLESVGFDNTQLASFYVCTDNWEKKVEITLIDMDADEGDMTPIMRETLLSAYVNHVGEKLVYEYDFVLMWRFMMEVTALEPFAGIPDQYPKVVESQGEAPAQYDTLEKYPTEVTDEDALFIRELETRNTHLFHPDDEDSEGEFGNDDEYGLDEFGEDDDHHGHGKDDWY